MKALRSSSQGVVHHPGPNDQGLLGWTYDPVGVASAFAVSAGVVYLLRAVPVVSGSATKAIVSVGTAGATVANAFLGLFDSAGNRIAVTADISTNLQSTGVKEVAFTAAVNVTAGAVYYVAFLVGSAGTLPQLHLAVGNAVGRAGESAAPFRFCFSGSGQTSIPATVTLGSATATDISYFAAIK